MLPAVVTCMALATPAGATAMTSTAVSAGGYHTCALTSAGGILCSGNNETGELGDGTTAEKTRPVEPVEAETEPHWYRNGVRIAEGIKVAETPRGRQDEQEDLDGIHPAVRYRGVCRAAQAQANCVARLLSSGPARFCRAS